LLDHHEQSALRFLGHTGRQVLRWQSPLVAFEYHPRQHGGAILFRSADNRDHRGRGAGLFVDGGLTPHNNPSLVLFLATVLPPYGLNWKTGAEHLSILSIGTGLHRPTLTAPEARKWPAARVALKALEAQVSDNEQQTLILMSWLGQASLQWEINLELGDLGKITPPFGNLFRYHRCDIKLEQEWLAQNLGVNLSSAQVMALYQMDNPSNIAPLYEYGRLAAETQITHDLFQDW
jgi:hypothetical protein